MIPQLSPDNVKIIMELYDVDKNGDVSFGEFLLMSLFINELQYPFDILFRCLSILSVIL